VLLKLDGLCKCREHYEGGSVTKKERQLQKLQKEVWKEKDAEQTAKAKKLVGKCFKFRNCYSCPKGDKDKWWLYTRIVGVKDGCCVQIQHEIDKDENVSIRRQLCSTRSFDSGDGYIPITLEEYAEAFKYTTRRGDFMEREAIRDQSIISLGSPK
jgi:hypothetical protein